VNYDEAFWMRHADWSSRRIANEYGVDDGSVRRKKREAKKKWPWLFDKTEVAKVTRGVAVFDLHYPHHNRPLWKNLLRFVSDFRPDVFIFGGDNLNMDAVDHWRREKNQQRALEGRRLKHDYSGFNRDILEPLSDALPGTCRLIWHHGNHEDWVEQYIDSHPEAEGFLEVETNLGLADWEIYDYGRSSAIGKLHVIHGEYVNEYNAAKTVRVYHRNIIYGHGHTMQAFTEITPLDSDAHTSTQIPCACNLNPDYRRNKPNAWLNGFAVFHVMPGGNFNLYPVVAFGGAFVAPNGEMYA